MGGAPLSEALRNTVVGDGKDACDDLRRRPIVRTGAGNSVSSVNTDECVDQQPDGSSAALTRHFELRYVCPGLKGRLDTAPICQCDERCRQSLGFLTRLWGVAAKVFMRHIVVGSGKEEASDPATYNRGALRRPVFDELICPEEGPWTLKHVPRVLGLGTGSGAAPPEQSRMTMSRYFGLPLPERDRAQMALWYPNLKLKAVRTWVRRGVAQWSLQLSAVL